MTTRRPRYGTITALLGTVCITLGACGHTPAGEHPIEGDSDDLAADGQSIKPLGDTLENEKERDDEVEETPSKALKPTKPKVVVKPKTKPAAAKARHKCERLVDHLWPLVQANLDMAKGLLPKIPWDDEAKAREQLVAECKDNDPPEDWVACALAATSLPDVMACGPPND